MQELALGSRSLPIKLPLESLLLLHASETFSKAIIQELALGSLSLPIRLPLGFLLLLNAPEQISKARIQELAVGIDRFVLGFYCC